MGEFLFQILAELLLQIIVEAAAEFGLQCLSDTFQRWRTPFLSAIGFSLWGAMAGGLSLLLFPRSFITNQNLRMINLALTPVLAGGIMMLIGRQRAKRGQPLVGLDRFAYAFAFAFMMALVRFGFAEQPWF